MNVDKFEPIVTLPRPHPCLVHLDNSCHQCHLCIERQLWSLEQNYALRFAPIQFEGRDPADATGDVMPSLVAKHRPQRAPVEMKAPRDAKLLYGLRLELQAEFDSATRESSAGAPESSFTFARADEQQEGAMLFMCGSIGKNGIHGGAGAAEKGEGRRLQPPNPPTDPRDEEGVPSRGTSAPPLSCNLTSVMSSKKIDFGWNENRILYARFGYLHLLGTNPPNECPMIIGSGDSLESIHLHLEISARHPCLTWSLVGTTYDVSQSIDIVKQFAQSVDQLSLRMDSGGWVLVTEFASRLGISIQELIRNPSSPLFL